MVVSACGYWTYGFAAGAHLSIPTSLILSVVNPDKNKANPEENTKNDIINQLASK